MSYFLNYLEKALPLESCLTKIAFASIIFFINEDRFSLSLTELAGNYSQKAQNAISKTPYINPSNSHLRLPQLGHRNEYSSWLDGMIVVRWNGRG